MVYWVLGVRPASTKLSCVNVNGFLPSFDTLHCRCLLLATTVGVTVIFVDVTFDTSKSHVRLGIVVVVFFSSAPQPSVLFADTDTA